MRVNRWMTDPFSGKETPSGLGRAAVIIQSLPSSNNTTTQPVLNCHRREGWSPHLELPLGL